MVNREESPTVIIEPSLNDDELTMDELAQYFEEL